MSLIWGINFPVVKAALPIVPPLAFNALRFPLASATMLVLLLWMRGRIPLPERGDLLRLVMLGVVGNVVYQSFFILGVDHTTAGNASLLLATLPAWTTILSTAVGHERLPASVWSGVVGALVGMVLVVAGGAGFGFSLATVGGDLLMVGAALAWSVYTVGARGMIEKYGPMAVTAWTLWIGTAGLVPLGLPQLRTLDLGTLGVGPWAAISYAGVLSIGVAYALWNRGVRRIGNARTAIYQNAVPVVALITAWFALGERPGPLQIAGAVLILASVRQARRPASTPPTQSVEPGPSSGR